MIVSGGQCPIRATVGTERGEGGPRRLPLLKNGPLCLAVYGGRDLAGLPSTDSHRGANRRGGEASESVETRTNTRARLTSSVFPAFYQPSVLFARSFFPQGTGNTFRGDSVRLRATPHNGRALADNRGVDTG